MKRRLLSALDAYAHSRADGFVTHGAAPHHTGSGWRFVRPWFMFGAINVLPVFAVAYAVDRYIESRKDSSTLSDKLLKSICSPYEYVSRLRSIIESSGVCLVIGEHGETIGARVELSSTRAPIAGTTADNSDDIATTVSRAVSRFYSPGEQNGSERSISVNVSVDPKKISQGTKFCLATKTDVLCLSGPIQAITQKQGASGSEGETCVEISPTEMVYSRTSYAGSSVRLVRQTPSSEWSVHRN